MLHLWFNTFFVENHVLLVPKSEIDKVAMLWRQLWDSVLLHSCTVLQANKDKKHKIYPSNFSVELFFEEGQALPEYERYLS